MTTKSDYFHGRPQGNTLHKTDSRAQYANSREFAPLATKQAERNDNDEDEVMLPDTAIVIPATAPAQDIAAKHPVGEFYEIAPPDRPYEIIRSHPRRHHIGPMVLAAAMALHHHDALARGHAHPHANAHVDSRVSCGVHTVSVRFSGVSGQRFKYLNFYEIPPSGTIELLAEPNIKTYEIDGLVLPLIGTQDKFAALSIRLPEPRHEPVQP